MRFTTISSNYRHRLAVFSFVLDKDTRLASYVRLYPRFLDKFRLINTLREARCENQTREHIFLFFEEKKTYTYTFNYTFN